LLVVTGLLQVIPEPFAGSRTNRGRRPFALDKAEKAAHRLPAGVTPALSAARKPGLLPPVESQGNAKVARHIIGLDTPSLQAVVAEVFQKVTSVKAVPPDNRQMNPPRGKVSRELFQHGVIWTGRRPLTLSQSQKPVEGPRILGPPVYKAAR